MYVLLWWISFHLRQWKNITPDAAVFLSPGRLPVQSWRRSWRAPWTSLLCAAAMGTPTPTSVPCVSAASEYTQLLPLSWHSHMMTSSKLNVGRMKCWSLPLLATGTILSPDWLTAAAAAAAADSTLWSMIHLMVFTGNELDDSFSWWAILLIFHLNNFKKCSLSLFSCLLTF